MNYSNDCEIQHAPHEHLWYLWTRDKKETRRGNRIKYKNTANNSMFGFVSQYETRSLARRTTSRGPTDSIFTGFPRTRIRHRPLPGPPPAAARLASTARPSVAICSLLRARTTIIQSPFTRAFANREQSDIANKLRRHDVGLYAFT